MQEYIDDHRLRHLFKNVLSKVHIRTLLFNHKLHYNITNKFNLQLRIMYFEPEQYIAFFDKYDNKEKNEIMRNITEMWYTSLLELAISINNIKLIKYTITK